VIEHEHIAATFQADALVLFIAVLAPGSAPLALFCFEIGDVTDRALVCAGWSKQEADALLLTALGAYLGIRSALLARKDAVEADVGQIAHLWWALFNALAA